MNEIFWLIAKKKKVCYKIKISESQDSCTFLEFKFVIGSRPPSSIWGPTAPHFITTVQGTYEDASALPVLTQPQHGCQPSPPSSHMNSPKKPWPNCKDTAQPPVPAPQCLTGLVLKGSFCRPLQFPVPTCFPANGPLGPFSQSSLNSFTRKGTTK